MVKRAHHLLYSNRSMTLEEVFSGKKPKVGHLRIFGCITYSHVPSEKRTKLEPTTERDLCWVQ
jgi:hypothetical protein